MIELDSVQTVAFGGLALFAGYGLCLAIPLLRRYNLPEPVLGGLLMLQAALGAGQGLEAGALAIRAGLTLLFTAGLARALLAARGLAPRAAQPVLAPAGSHLLFVLASLPVLFSIAGQVAEGDLSGPALPIALLAIVLFLWKLRVEAAIWRHALDVPALPALALAVSKGMTPSRTRRARSWSMVCMPKEEPVCMTLTIWETLASRMRFLTAGVANIRSVATTLPPPIEGKPGTYY